MVDKTSVGQALARVADPAGGGNVVESGRVTGVTAKPDGTVGLVLSLDGIENEQGERLRGEVERTVRNVPGVTGLRIILTAERDAPPGERVAKPSPVTGPAPIPGIRQIIAVASGKGGVGKSTVAANLAIALARGGRRVALLDADIYGPSVPTLLGQHQRAGLIERRIQPVEAHGIAAISIGSMTDPDKAVIWRGPMAASAMTQMLTETDWGERDILVLDLPPGTGDIQLTMAQKIPLSGAVVVSTPQDLALIDAKRAIAMFGKVGVPVLGIVENMSTFVCPHCGKHSDIFGHGGAEETSQQLGVPFLGAIPLHAAIREASDAGRPPAASDGPQAEPFHAIAARVAATLG